MVRSYSWGRGTRHAEEEEVGQDTGETDEEEVGREEVDFADKAEATEGF
jgi:hypothetical protein